MTKKEKWLELVRSSEAAIEDFNDFTDDQAIVWANTELKKLRIDLQPVITWLENGCDVSEAVKELKLYQNQINNDLQT